MEEEAFQLYQEERFKEAELIFNQIRGTSSNRDELECCFLNIASCKASEGCFNEALEIFNEIKSQSCEILYNKSLCHYELENYTEVFEFLDKLFTLCQELYPDLMATNLMLKDDDEEHSNRLYDSCLIEATNLKAATIFKLTQDTSASLDCLKNSLLNLEESEMDTVTLHNCAIFELPMKQEYCLDKLNYICKLDIDDDLSIPKELYKNLLTIQLYLCRYDQLESTMRLFKSEIDRYISDDVVRLIGILSQKEATDEKICLRLEKLLDDLVERYKQFDRDLILDSREKKDAVELILTVCLHQGFLMWNQNNYHLLEKLLLKITHLVGDTLSWKLNMANTLYMQDTRFADSSNLYEDCIKGLKSERLLDVDPMLLSNLCVSYVLTGRNADAEALIKEVEADYTKYKEEVGDWSETVRRGPFPKRILPVHLSSINLSISTLYCVKFNYEFGIIRMIKTFEPLEQNLHANTWFYAKRCILSLLDLSCKQMVCVKDDIFNQLVSFLIDCEKFGSYINGNTKEKQGNSYDGRNSIAHESRYLRYLILKIYHE